MEENDNEGEQIIKSESNSSWEETKRGWSNAFSIIFKVQVVIPTLIALVFMYVSFESSSKNISLISTLIASGLLAIAGAIGYDGYKSIVGESVLIKKGKGAVRNLYLIVEKINNTSLRTNVEDFNKDEIINLLSLVEKDVVNSIQEWEDVVPGLAAIPYYNKYISEREEELKTATEKLKETEELLIKTTDLAVDSEQKKESLEKEIISYKETIKSKETEIRQLQGARDIQVVTASTAATGTSGYGGRTIIPDSVFRNPPLPPPPYPRGLRAAHLLSKSEKQANNLADQEP